MLDLCRRCSDGRHRDFRCLRRREAVYASGDSREGNAAGSDLVGNLKATPIARGQDVSLTVATAFPHGADGVNDMAYWWVQVESWCGDCVAGIAGCERGTCLRQSRSCRTMNRPIYTAATQQRLIGGGNDGIDVLASDITKHNFDHGHTSMMSSRQSEAAGAAPATAG